MFHVLIGTVYIRGCVKTLFTTDYTDYHRIRMLIINNLKITLCYSVSSVVSFDTPSFSSSVSLNNGLFRYTKNSLRLSDINFNLFEVLAIHCFVV
ncbi:hypothetical protein F7887_13840 [Bacteroides fragilis]|nr:hypothetical protein F7887_13840 [Bacteroides fragilis]RHH68865.1 hypothetical protein DW198_08060 [Bacteroides fragilis]